MRFERCGVWKLLPVALVLWVAHASLYEGMPKRSVESPLEQFLKVARNAAPATDARVEEAAARRLAVQQKFVRTSVLLCVIAVCSGKFGGQGHY